MTRSTATLPHFSEYCWGVLPIRKHCVGREAVNDSIIAIVQYWPVERLCQCDAGSQGEAFEFLKVLRNVKKTLDFIYGEERFEGYWRMGLKSIVIQLIDITNHWWRRSKRNRANLNIWRRKWMGDE